MRYMKQLRVVSLSIQDQDTGILEVNTSMKPGVRGVFDPSAWMKHPRIKIISHKNWHLSGWKA